MSSGRSYRSGRTAARRLVPLERDVLSAVLHLARLHPAVAWIARSNSGLLASPDGKRRILAAWTGAADLTGQLVDGRRLEIEVKGPVGRVRPSQRAFLDTVNQFGGVAGVVRSADEAMALLDSAHESRPTGKA